MSHSRLLLVISFIISFAIAATAFHASLASPVTAGSIAAAGQMLEPRSGHTATLLPDGRVLIARRHAAQPGLLQLG